MTKPKVVWAEQNQLKQYEQQVNQIYQVLGVKAEDVLFSSDMTTLSMIVCAYMNNIQVSSSYEKYICTKLFLGLNVQFEPADLHKPLIEVCKKIKASIPEDKKFNQVDYYWLDIKHINQNQDKISTSWVFTVVDQFFYQKGYALTINDKKFNRQVLELETEVMGSNKMEVVFNSEPSQIFNSLFEVYCFLIARVANYQPHN